MHVIYIIRWLCRATRTNLETSIKKMYREIGLRIPHLENNKKTKCARPRYAYYAKMDMWSNKDKIRDEHKGDVWVAQTLNVIIGVTVSHPEPYREAIYVRTLLGVSSWVWFSLFPM